MFVSSSTKSKQNKLFIFSYSVFGNVKHTENIMSVAMLLCTRQHSSLKTRKTQLAILSVDCKVGCRPACVLHISDIMNRLFIFTMKSSKKSDVLFIFVLLLSMLFYIMTFFVLSYSLKRFFIFSLSMSSLLVFVILCAMTTMLLLYVL